MGLVYADIELVNGAEMEMARRGYISESDIVRLKMKALVDSGAYMLVIPEHIKIQLGLIEIDKREAVTADGEVHVVPVVGPVTVYFKNRIATCNAMVMGTDEVLLGAIPLEELDVVIDQRNQRLVVNPENPTMPKMVVK